MAEKKTTENTFESAVERLEQIVEAMEGGELPLEEMLERYEEGTRLVKLCNEKLAAAEKRIETVTRHAAGKPQIAEYDPETPAAPRSEKGASKPKPADDVSLF
ncbi:MAG: exodeoxyribonuclease VII small subunit [Verrucomicrobiota bacterium]